MDQRAINRFWQRVAKSSDQDCWLWTGSTVRSGYGRFWLNGKTRIASRVSYELAFGPIGDNLVCHRCDNPACVNPAHLFLGSSKDNAQDRTAKGRGAGMGRTHCPRGHEYNEANTYLVRGTRRRMCRECGRLVAQRIRAAKLTRKAISLVGSVAA